MTKLHFIFSGDPFRKSRVDDMFSEQCDALRTSGFTVSVCTDQTLLHAAPLLNLPDQSTVVYRGWMLAVDEYDRLVDAIAKGNGCSPLTSAASYLATHYLPNWYPLIEPFTPETRLFSLSADLVQELRALNWPAFFIKDYVKSLKTTRGAVINDPSEVLSLLSDMEKFRGRIEGGICVRRVESLVADSEVRYFAMQGRAYSADGADVPEVVQRIVPLIKSDFFSIDVAQRSDGCLRIIEIGDGQVSDLTGWTAEAFARMCKMAAGSSNPDKIAKS